MFKNIEEIKSFIIWCKENKVKHASINGVTFEFSDLALILNENGEPMLDKVPDFTTPQHEMEAQEYEETLFHSSI